MPEYVSYDKVMLHRCYNCNKAIAVSHHADYMRVDQIHIRCISCYTAELLLLEEKKDERK